MEIDTEANKSPLCVFCLSPPFSVLPYQSLVIPAPRRPATIARWRRGECSYPRIRPRFKPNPRRALHTLHKYLAGRVLCRRRDVLSLQEVVSTLRLAWTSPKIRIKSSGRTSNNMDDRFRKTSCITSSEVSSPVLLRRRLSAPETIMRKHMLAQQRSESQDSDVTQASECRSCQYRMDVGSDSNLTRKRDTGLMRKSTLLRRLWGNSRPLLERSRRFSGAYSEWQYSCGKLSNGKSTHSLNSNHSSPEHLKSLRSLSGDEFRSPKQSTSSLSSSRKVSPKHMYEIKGGHTLSPPRRKISVYNGNYQETSSSNTYRGNLNNTTTTIDSASTENRISVTTSYTTSTPKTVTTETESETSARRTGTSTSYSDNSDSAYTNSQSNFSQSSTISETVYSSETQRYAEEEVNENNQNANEIKHRDGKKFILNDNAVESAYNNNINNNNNSNTKSDEVSETEKFIKYSNSFHESSTQTPDTANLNVISNVQLSQSTLNLIFNQVLQDVQNKQPNSINVKTLSATIPVTDDEVPESKVINVQQIPSFYLKPKDEVVISPEHNRIIKYMISNVGTGSAYSKPAEVPQVVVPRYSALPRTSSMEVNTSSGDSTDKESDTVSLVDSLEDPMSPRGDQNISVKHDDKPVRGDLSLLLPDNSDRKKSRAPQKTSAFFIPIENDKQENGKAVADHLPAKVKEKLSRRQLKREQKLQQSRTLISPRSDSNYISASDNGNHITFTVNNNQGFSDVKGAPVPPDMKSNKSRKRSKPLLPSIETIRKLKIDSKDNIKYSERERFKDKSKRNYVSKYDKVEAGAQNSKTKSWTSKTRHKGPEKLAPIYTTKNEYICDGMSRKIYHKAELNNTKKHIEILEIMECLDESEQRAQSCVKTGRSKIPILVQQKLPKIERKPAKPIYLDFENLQVIDPKIDQLIANILIDTLHKCEIHSCSPVEDSKSHILKFSNEKRPAAALPSQVKISSAKYQQKFEVIPEELSLQSSVEDNSNKNTDAARVNGNIIENAADLLTKQVLNTVDREEQEQEQSNKSTKEEDPYKGKEAIPVVKDDNLSTIPQGWITFYMLHKNQGSPDSTSDEGTKNSDNLKADKKEHKKENCDVQEDSRIKIQDKQVTAVSAHNHDFRKKENSKKINLDSMSSSDTFSENLYPVLPPNNGRCKRQHTFRKNNSNNRDFTNNEQNTSNEWSVTVSGSNSYGQSAPDVEMRLKFQPPEKHVCQYQSDSGFGEENDRVNEHLPHASKGSCYLLKRHNLQHNCGSTASMSATKVKNEGLPEITQNKRLSKRCDSSIPTSSMVPVRMEPRQTKTSTRRCALNRPRNLPPATSRINTKDFLNLSAESQLAAILSRFPEILSINGNGISPERKPRVATMSERDLTRNFYPNPR